LQTYVDTPIWIDDRLWGVLAFAGVIAHRAALKQEDLSLVEFACNQGIATIAEGVEDEETAHRLYDVGVDWAQGYFFGHPELDKSVISATH